MRPGLLCPGKAADHLRAERTDERFNEAGAVMPRKAYSAMFGKITAGASMRPGLLCPGKAVDIANKVLDAGGFNEAGAVMPRKGPAE